MGYYYESPPNINQTKPNEFPPSIPLALSYHSFLYTLLFRDLSHLSPLVFIPYSILAPLFSTLTLCDETEPAEVIILTTIRSPPTALPASLPPFQFGPEIYDSVNCHRLCASILMDIEVPASGVSKSFLARQTSGSVVLYGHLDCRLFL